jgi:hypothetical protein
LISKKKSADDLALEMARYMMAGLPIPENLMDGLMAVVCEEEKAKRENNSKGSDQANSH